MRQLAAARNLSLLAASGGRRLTRLERETAKRNARDAAEMMLLTDDVRGTNLTVRDEVENGLYFLGKTIWKELPQVYHDIIDAGKEMFGDDFLIHSKADLPAILRYSSWIGGDRDG